MEEREAAWQWAKALCYYAGEDEVFLEQFWEALTASEGIYKEFVYYLTNQTFLCQYKVEGYSVVDIMVWQMDHFKAQMDRGHDDISTASLYNKSMASITMAISVEFFPMV